MPDPSQIQKNAENAALRAENLQAKINRLREEWLEKKNIRLHAPKNEESAERNLYVNTGRWKQYDGIKKERWEKEAQKTVDEWSEFFTQYMNFMEGVIPLAKSQSSYKNELNEVHNSYKNKYTSLVDKVDNTYHKYNVNNRLSQFYDTRIEVLRNVNYYLFYLYWIILIPIIITFFWKKQFTYVKIPIFFIIMLIFPFFLGRYLPLVFSTFKHQKIDYSYLAFIFVGFFVIYSITTIASYTVPIDLSKLPVAKAIPIK